MPTRREMLIAGALFAALGCERRTPETPLAHLHGKAWVSGAYSHYAEAYLDVERRARTGSFGAYRILAQKGVAALEGLQQREVPFFVRVAGDASSFRIERELPERLTFTADMNAGDRERATRIWKLAREHIHHDYEEIHRLDFALTALLGELVKVRRAIDEGRVEQFRLVRQLRSLDSGGELPFALPRGVARADYHSVLLLLIERIEGDRERLRHTEAALVAVGLTARATDTGSASLSSNVKKVLLGVIADSNAPVPSASYPEREDERAPALGRARALRRAIEASPEYRSWLGARLEDEDAFGRLLVLLDAATGLPTSGIYKQMMRVWRGDGDYLGYLELALALVPGGSAVGKDLSDAVSRTKSYREELRRVGSAKALRSSELAGALVNLGTEHARQKLDRQLAFLGSAAEEREVAEALAETALMKEPMPAVPRR